MAADDRIEIDLAAVEAVLEEVGATPDKLIPILQGIQQHYGYLPEPALRRVCELTQIKPASIIGVSSFYSQFRHRPVGKHIVSVCHGTACHVKGAPLVTQALLRHLQIPDGDDTDPDGIFTVQKVACIGCCTLAPAVQIDSITYGYQSPDTIAKMLRDFLELERRGLLNKSDDMATGSPASGLAEMRVCLDSCCRAGGTGEVYEALESAVQASAAPAVIKRVGCVLMCHQVPLIEVKKPGKEAAMYAKVTREDAGRIVRKHFKPHGITRKFSDTVSRGLESLLTDEAWEPVTRYAIDSRDAPVCQFLGPQRHIALEQYGAIEPLIIDEYINSGGFEGLRKCLDASPEQVIETVTASGLRGRGGAGFPTGRKWSMVRAAEGDIKYVVCNGDEGDPGAFMDRMLLETFPFRVLEGIIIAAYAVGANEGHLYVRAEYPLAVKNVKAALRVLEERGYLGENILGSGFSLRLNLMQGAGAFVCGEETALLASIEGRRGTPRLRPPYPAQQGLWKRPTNINNVETYAMIPWILRNGHEAFTEIGTKQSKGTKVFALAGKVVRGGLIEVPMGTTVRQIVEEIGGGIADGHKFKAVQIGGPSGGCLPASLADTPIDYEELQEHGAIMGSGGLVVLDDTDCMVDVARFFLEFTQDESCGKCTPCRIGTKRMLEIIHRLCEGHGKLSDIDELEHLAHAVKRGSLCGLGQTAPNPVLTTIHFFRAEYEAHANGRCPAGKCAALIKYVVNEDCIGCTLCAQNCPADAIEMKPYEQHFIDMTKCTRCDSCRQLCPQQAIKVE